MSRFFVTSEAVGESHITITSAEDIAHISKVLRMKVGDIIDISDSAKWEYRCEIVNIEKDEIQGKILDKQGFAREPETEITLFQGVPKQGKMEIIVQKNVELGVKEIVPVFMARSVVSDNGKYGKKVQRYNTISEQAAKQCKRGIIPKVFDAVKFKEMVTMLNAFDMVIFPYENEEDLTIKDVIRKPKKKPKKIAVIIGPEGGFADEEADILQREKAISVSLGKTILRTETAGMTAVAMIMYELEL